MLRHVVQIARDGADILSGASLRRALAREVPQRRPLSCCQKQVGDPGYHYLSAQANLLPLHGTLQIQGTQNRRRHRLRKVSFFDQNYHRVGL